MLLYDALPGQKAADCSDTLRTILTGVRGTVRVLGKREGWSFQRAQPASAQPTGGPSVHRRREIENGAHCIFRTDSRRRGKEASR